VLDLPGSRALATGSSLLYSTYLGGSGGASASAIAVDTLGNAYVAGITAADDFPTVNPLQDTNRGADKGSSNAFVVEFDGAGSTLLFSTYLGGSGGSANPHIISEPPPPPPGDSATSIAVDFAGNVYVAGSTASSDFPLFNPVQDSKRGPSYATTGFVSKIAIAPRAISPPWRGGGGAIGWGVVAGLGLALVARARRTSIKSAPPVR
jgi:hypothetical protein